MKRIVRGLVAAACGLPLALAAMSGSAGATSTGSAAATATGPQQAKTCQQ